ncbi:MAG: L-fucose:H+ symporter permease [Leadbetterella sp.]|nr:L-fucose:H+ symporter permease [Leadbetterella sp.]
MKEKNQYLIPFILVTCLFFMWGLANNLTGVLIPHLRKALELSNTQSTLVDTAVYFAYFIAAIPAGLLLKKTGYKNGIITGLLIFSTGCLLFIPAANSRDFTIFLLGSFIIGTGLATLETAANPYAARLGPEESATTRLNLAQSFNGLAATAAPFLGTLFILSGKELSPEELAVMSEAERVSYFTAEASSVKGPYLIIAIILLVLALVFYFRKFPEVEEVGNNKQESGSFLAAWKYPGLRAAVITQFFYVGAQVCITSFFIRMAMTGGGMGEKEAGSYLSMYGALFMIGRFAGTGLTRVIAPPRLLAIYSVAAILLCFMAIHLEGSLVVFALGALGFFLSIMFPTIFSLGIKGLGQHTKAGSSLIVMAIIGGGIFPVIMGNVIDRIGDNIQPGYYVPMMCFVVVLGFALWNMRRLKVKS